MGYWFDYFSILQPYCRWKESYFREEYALKEEEGMGNGIVWHGVSLFKKSDYDRLRSHSSL